MNFSRKSQINLLEQNNEYDLLVIGGGVVGSIQMAVLILY